MSTRSTKSSSKKKASALASGVDEKVNPTEIVEVNDGEVSERTWRISVAVIFCVAALLRLYDLNLVPLHHDEGVNGNFLVRLVREGAYRYDPANYHGPTLYYFAALIPWAIKLLFGAAARDSYGLTTVTIRLVPALFGLGTIVLIFLLRRHLGSIATLAAALFLAVSPGAVYLSRYFIHETHFVFFTLGIVVAGVRFYDERRPSYLLLAFASAALLFATKETAMISVGVLAIAFVLTRAYMRVANSGKRPKKLRRQATTRAPGFKALIEQMGGFTTLALWLALGIVVFVTINVFFYSSFFKNYPQGVYDSLKTFQFWANTGKAQHVHPFGTYVEWLFKQESPLILLGSIGAGFAVLKPKNSFALFSALWAFGIIAAYSLVPYKTPWLALNFIVPLAIISGYAVQVIYKLDLKQLRFPVTVMAVALAVSSYQTIDLNFFNYDNDDSYYVYVYAHTKRGTLALLKSINTLAQKSQQKDLTGITIVSPDYWPLPWYLRDYSRVGYFAHMTTTNEPIIIASETQRAEMSTNFGELYEQVPSGEGDGSFALRPGVNLLLYVRRSGFLP